MKVSESIRSKQKTMLVRSLYADSDFLPDKTVFKPEIGFLVNRTRLFFSEIAIVLLYKLDTQMGQITKWWKTMICETTFERLNNKHGPYVLLRKFILFEQYEFLFFVNVSKFKFKESRSIFKFVLVQQFAECKSGKNAVDKYIISTSGAIEEKPCRVRRQMLHVEFFWAGYSRIDETHYVWVKPASSLFQNIFPYDGLIKYVRGWLPQNNL
jgi:hypothetical protein